MLEFIFFILFTPGASEFLCTSSDLELSYAFCDSSAHYFKFNVTPCSMLNRSVWHAAITWIPSSIAQSTDWHCTYHCESAQVLLEKANKLLVHTSFSGLKKTHAILRGENIQAHQDYEYAHSRNWKYESDVAYLKIVFTVWYEGARALRWRQVMCSGTDDEYSLCGGLKGETIETEFDIKGKRTLFPKGYYDVILQAFPDDSEQNTIMCLNITMIVKKDAF